MACMFCKKETEGSIIRCGDCTGKTINFSLKGTNWASNSNTERLSKWNQNQSTENLKTDLSDIGMI